MDENFLSDMFLSFLTVFYFKKKKSNMEQKDLRRFARYSRAPKCEGMPPKCFGLEKLKISRTLAKAHLLSKKFKVTANSVNQIGNF